MKEQLSVSKVNESFIKVSCSASVAMELSEYFSFEQENAKFSPKYRARIWDGRIRLFNLVTNTMYAGLYLRLLKFCKDRDYDLIKVPTEYGLPLDIHPIKPLTLDQFIDVLRLPENRIPHDYQVAAIYNSLRHKGKLNVSPTGSGKSLIIYIIARYLTGYNKLYGRDPNKSLLIVVPTTGLVEQLHSDFKEYSVNNGWDVDRKVAKLYSGLPKIPTAPIVISTWQSIYQQPKEYFQRYFTVIGDEAHGYTAKSLVAIMSKSTEAEWRIGTTGTLDGIETNSLTLEGLFGSIQQVATTKELMDRGLLAKLNIKCVVLKYSEEERKQVIKAKDYASEMDFIVNHGKRNRFICRLAMAQTGNTLILFQYVEKHGKVLYEAMKKMAGDRKVFYIHGGVDIEDREAIRKILSTEKDAHIVASYGTFKLGINVPNIRNIIFANPSKSKIRNLQSIGRGLRVAEGKSGCTLYDIADDLQYKGKENHTIRHFVERINIYNNEEFDYTINEVQLTG